MKEESHRSGVVVVHGWPAEMASENCETAGEGIVSGDGSVEGSKSTAGNNIWQLRWETLYLLFPWNSGSDWPSDQNHDNISSSSNKNICSSDLGNGSTNFLPMKSFTGEGEQNDENSFERWMDHNEEHAWMAPWPVLVSHFSQPQCGLSFNFRMLPEKDAP